MQPIPILSQSLLVSVIVPTFNSENTIGRCLESVLSQSFPSFEVIVVDGVSKDNTLSLVESASRSDSRVRFISEKDGGVYEALNKGVRLAAGNWLLFLGSDDRLHNSEVLSRIAPFLEPQLDFVYGNVRVCGETGWSNDNAIYDGEFDATKLARKNICHQSIFYQRELFKKFGLYNPAYRVCADWEFNLRVFLGSRRKYVDMIVAEFHGGGLSTQSSDALMYDRFLELVTQHLKLSPFHPFYKDYINRLEAVVRRECRQRHFRKAIRYGMIWAIHGPVRQWLCAKSKRLMCPA